MVLLSPRKGQAYHNCWEEMKEKIHREICSVVLSKDFFLIFIIDNLHAPNGS